MRYAVRLQTGNAISYYDTRTALAILRQQFLIVFMARNLTSYCAFQNKVRDCFLTKTVYQLVGYLLP